MITCSKSNSEWRLSWAVRDIHVEFWMTKQKPGNHRMFARDGDVYRTTTLWILHDELFEKKQKYHVLMIILEHPRKSERHLYKPYYSRWLYVRTEFAPRYPNQLHRLNAVGSFHPRPLHLPHRQDLAVLDWKRSMIQCFTLKLWQLFH